MMRASSKFGNMAAYRVRMANALAKTHYGRGLVATASLTINVVYSYLSEFYNRIGEVAEIDLSSMQGEYGTHIDKLYGRLVSVSYQISADVGSFTAHCSLGFDCVCNEEEHNIFGVTAEDMLCTPKKKK
jgi:hypothetical protein